MSRKNGVRNEETMRIRMSTDLFNRIRDAKVPAGWGEEADSSFARHLIVLGINEIEENIRIKQIVNKNKYEKKDTHSIIDLFKYPDTGTEKKEMMS